MNSPKSRFRVRIGDICLPKLWPQSFVHTVVEQQLQWGEKQRMWAEVPEKLREPKGDRNPSGQRDRAATRSHGGETVARTPYKGSSKDKAQTCAGRDGLHPRAGGLAV